MFLDKNYWSKRYEEHNTPWDIGIVSTPIQTYFDTIKNKDLSILIPGAGRAHEGIYLFQNGFKHVIICDWAEEALKSVKKECPEFPNDQLINTDFFTLDGEFDLILEQTFFCAIDPKRRNEYAQKVHSLLKPDGELVGLLFAHEFPFDGPPFGGRKEEYLEIFNPYFEIEKMEPAYNSITPRQGNELFVHFRKKNI